jgi:hypothetical protein
MVSWLCAHVMSFAQNTHNAPRQGDVCWVILSSRKPISQCLQSKEDRFRWRRGFRQNGKRGFEFLCRHGICLRLSIILCRWIPDPRSKSYRLSYQNPFCGLIQRINGFMSFLLNLLHDKSFWVAEVTQLIKKCSAFMGYHDISPCSREPATGPYLHITQSCLVHNFTHCFSTHCFQIINLIYSSLCNVLQPHFY